MATCPAGHDSATDDYCDVCGAPMPGAEVVAPSARVEAAASGGGDEGTCAACGAVRVGRFCEECGHDSLNPVPAAPPVPRSEPTPVPVSWHVTVEADRAYFERVVAVGGPDAGAMAFPRFCPPRRFELSGPQVSVGRRSRSRGIFPQVDLVGPPEDPGVSHHHALLVASEGGWAVVDLDSTNGTTVNEGGEPLRPNRPHPLEPGDRVHVGAWTTITLHRSGGPAG
ncbi:FHA domain-containing protein [Actinosynnema sp. NPDC050801]|uniref:FHA domain-containing protein n=1 Tax=unclassified Actinosynnema TaxID=2637065 RepID=UPI0034071B57